MLKRKEETTSKGKPMTGRFMKRTLAFALAAMMVINVPTPVQAFSLKGAFKKITSSVSNLVKSVNSFTDSSDNKTVNSYAELNSFLCSLFAPTNIKVKLGSDITVPANKTISSVLHNVDMDMNGHTIYSNNSSYTVSINFGRNFKVKNGTFVQKVNNSNGIIEMFSGDATFTDVTFKKSSNVSKVTGLYISGYNSKPQITFQNVTFNGMTTGLNILSGGKVILNNSNIYNTQGDAVYLQDQYEWLLSNTSTQQSSFTMTGGKIRYFKGNGIVAGKLTQTTLDGVNITGGTTRNRYGIRTANTAHVSLKNTQVYSNAGGNIGVNKCENSSECPVTIDSLASGNYSFTVMDKIAGNDNNTYTVASVSNAFSGELESYKVYSDISRYMVLADEGNKSILIQNPPEQCETDVTLEWKSGTKALDETKDKEYATVSVNGGNESESGSAITKYAQKVTLSTTNNNPARYEFLGWEKYVGNTSKGIINTNPTCQVKAVDANATFKAVYQYKTYKLTIRTSGKGTVTRSGAKSIESNGVTYTYYVDDQVQLDAKPNDAAKDSKGNAVTYGFKKWSDGKTETSRTITVEEDTVYTAMFTKTGQTKGTMYLNVKEVNTLQDASKAKNLLLIYIGTVDGSENNKLENSQGLVGITGLPNYSAKLTPTGTTTDHGRQKVDTISSEGIDRYGYGVTPAKSMLSVNVVQAGGGFDTCTTGYIGKYNVRGKDCWLYWCSGGGVNAVGPYALYSYSDEKSFVMNDVKIKMEDDYAIRNETQEIDKNAISVTVKVGETTYTLGGLKFKADDLDDEINYAEGDRSINFELDGVPVDYNFPEATISGKQYTSLSEAIGAATDGETIKIVGPGVDSIDTDKKVTLKDGVKIQGYDGDTATAVGNSEIGIDKDGMVRLFEGELEVNPQSNEETSVGVKDAFATTDKTIHVRTDENGKPYIVPETAGTKLIISPDNNREHLVEITGTKQENKYGFNDLESYDGELVKIAKETEYSVNLPKAEGEESAPSIKTSKYNTGDTVIEPAADGNNSMPNISSSAEGDKVTVGNRTYTTGPIKNDKSTKYRVNPDSEAEPNVILEQGSLGIPKDTSIKVGDKVIKNTGAENGSDSSVRVNAEGEIDIPNGGRVSIDGVQISVPNATPMNGNTKVVLDKDGKPHIKTTGGSDVTITVPGKAGQSTTFTYKAGDYDCELEIGEDGIPVLKNGDILLKPGQIIKDSEGNEYQGSENSNVTIMTTPKVYETDEDGNPLYDENGNPILIGGGDMGFEIPKGDTINCKPNGQNEFRSFENPGDSDGFFTLDPTKAAEGLQSDSELGLAAGKELKLDVGNEQGVMVKAPESGNQGTIKVDGSIGNITLSNAGDKIVIDGKIYEVTKNNTILNVNENGVSLVEGGLKLDENGAVTDTVKVMVPKDSEDSVQLIRENNSAGGTEGGLLQQTKIQVTGKKAFTVAPISDANAGMTLASNTDGTQSYVLNEDGTLTLSKGDSIVRKGAKKDVIIQAPENADITSKPLAKADKEEIEGGYATPASGLVVEVPNGNEVTIGGENYKAVELNRGYEQDEQNPATLPLQLVLGEDGDVILNDGTVELSKDSSISVYDVDNKLATITNKSQDADKKVQVTKPGIVTMPKAGTTVSMKENKDKNSVDFTSTKDDTQIVFTPEVCVLKKGGVELGKNEKIVLGDTIIKNNAGDDKKVAVESIETIKQEKVIEDGKEVTRDVMVHTGKVTITKGGSFEASYPDAKNTISYASNDPNAESTEFIINEDGNIVMPAGALATINQGTENEVKIQADGENIESTPTPDGIIFAIPKNGSIVVNGKKYTNKSDDTLVLAVDSNGKVILVQGEVELSEGSIVYVENEQEGFVPIANNTKDTAEGQASPQPIKVSYEGTKEKTDESGQVIGTTYPEVAIEIPKGNEIGIGTNEYSNNLSEDSGTTGLTTKINLDLTKATGSAAGKNDISESKVTLKEGSVDLGVGSGITVGKGANKKVLSNVGASDSQEEGTNPVRVNADATVKLPVNSGVISTDANGKETKIQVPKNTSAEDDYQAEVNLNNSNNKVEVKLTPSGNTSGSLTSGSDKKVIINDGTYTSKEEEKNLTLEVGSDKKVSMTGNTTNVGLSNNAAITVGDTTVTAGEKDDKIILVKETDGQTESGATVKVPQVDIPNGGQANFKNPEKKQDMNVAVPEKEEGEGGKGNGQQISVDPSNGQLSTNLKKDDKVVIGGIEYTGTSDDAQSDNTIKVDGTSGELVEGGEGSSKPSVSAKIDVKQFNKAEYRYTITAGSSVTVNGVEYKASESSIVLIGNPDGDPIVEIQAEGGRLQIGDKSYTAVNAKSRFVVDKSGNITLMGNGSETAGSSIKLGGNSAQKVNGVTYRGSSEDDSYTITYTDNGCVVEPADGTKLQADIPNGTTIYLAGKGAVDSINDKGEKITETFEGPLPIKMTDGNRSIYLDKTVKDYTDTTYVSVSGLADLKLSYSGSEDSKKLTSIEIIARKQQQSSQTEGKTDAGSKGNITVKDNTTGKDVSIPVEIKDDKVVVSDIPKDTMDQVIETKPEGTKSLVLDCSSAEKNKVELKVSTVDTIAKKADEVRIITKQADITVDKTAAKAIVEQAKGTTVEIKVSDEKMEELLNKEQMTTAKKYDVRVCLDAYVESNGVRIHDFNHGMVRVGIPWTVEKGRKAAYYHIYYMDEQGTMESYDTAYEDGKLWFETGHFSEYVIIYDADHLNDTLINQTPLLVKCTKTTKNSIRVEWKKVNGVKSYDVYVARCNTKNKVYKLKKVASVDAKRSGYAIKNLKAGTSYKIVVKAMNGKKCINKSMVLHVVTKGGKYNNASALKAIKKNISLSKNKTTLLKMQYKSDKKSLAHGAALRFVSSNKEVATVDKNGKVSAKHAGTCQIYAFLNDGEYVAVNVTVK